MRKPSNTAVMASLRRTKREGPIGAAISSRVFSQDSYLKYHRVSFDSAGFGMIDSLFGERERDRGAPDCRSKETCTRERTSRNRRVLRGREEREKGLSLGNFVRAYEG